MLPAASAADRGDRRVDPVPAATGAGPLGTGATPVLAGDTLAPGELVLLYSDGLVERPHRTLDEGMAELVAVAVAADAAADRALPLDAAPTPAERGCQLTVELLTRTGHDRRHHPGRLPTARPRR